MPTPYPNQKALDAIWGVVCMINGEQAGPVKTSRKQEEVILRHVFWTIAKEETTVSLNQLAMYSGVDHHTSVLHGIRRVRKSLELTARGKYVEPAVAKLYLESPEEYLILDTQGEIPRPKYEQTILERKYSLTKGFL